MAYALLIIGLVVAVFGWVKNRVALLAVCHFMKTKNYPPPTEEEAKASSKFVIERILKRRH